MRDEWDWKTKKNTKMKPIESDFYSFRIAQKILGANDELEP